MLPSIVSSKPQIAVDLPERQGRVKVQSCGPVHEAADGVALWRRPEAPHLKAANIERPSEVEVVAHRDDLAVVAARQPLQKAAVKAALEKCSLRWNLMRHFSCGP